MSEQYQLKKDFLKSLVPDLDLDEDIYKKVGGLDKAMVYAVNVLGGTVGAPLGFLPILTTYFGAGLGRKVEYESQRIYQTNRLTPEMVVNLWRRGFPSSETRDMLFDQLFDMGWSPEQVEGLKVMASVLPSPSDVIRFAVREAYTPEIAEKYGQYQDFPEKAMVDAAMIGLSKDLLSKYWAAHWDLPSATQGFEMFHRGQITFDELKTLLRALDIMPYWRDKLINIAYNLITRVDVRRMWDMRVYDDAKLLLAYKKMGYDDQDAQDLTLWTKVYQTFPDLIARYKNGWINESEVIGELVRLGMSESTATELYQTKIKKPVQQERIIPERELTKAEIYKGVKQKKLTDDEAINLIKGMGYDDFEAKFLVNTNCHATASPETPLEFQQLVNSYNKALGRPTVEVSQDKLEAERAILEAKKKLAIAREAKTSPDILASLEADVYEAEAHFRVL